MRDIKKRLSVWAVVVAVLLTVPFLLMQFHIKLYDPGSGYEEINWTWGDFVFAGVLLFGSAAVYELATKNVPHYRKRIAIGAAVFVILAIIWVGAATGFGA